MEGERGVIIIGGRVCPGRLVAVAGPEVPELDHDALVEVGAGAAVGAAVIDIEVRDTDASGCVRNASRVWLSFPFAIVPSVSW